MLRRFIEAEVIAALADTPVVLVIGARQTGKSTLLQLLTKQDRVDDLLTFDDLTVLGAAQNDPEGFVRGLPSRVAIDEVQRVPEVILPIKAAVDRDRRPGRFLLTGSTNVLALPKLADSLAGRMQVITMHPLSQGELVGKEEGFLRRLFDDTAPKWRTPAIAKGDLLARVATGGYPEVVARPSRKRQEAWFSAYLTTILSREVRALSNMDALSELPRVLKALAARTANLLNVAELGRELGMPSTTLRRYLALLTATFLTSELPAWSVNISKRLVKAPKILLSDTGLCTHLLGIDGLAPDHRSTGALVETFVANEVIKQIQWHEQRLVPYHFRAQSGEEVDLVLEAPDGAVAGIEVKFVASVGPRDLRGLKLLREAAGKRFRRGVVLYAGERVVPLGDGLTAVPIAALWASYA